MRVLVQDGQAVKAGQTLLIVGAMKMVREAGGDSPYPSPPPFPSSPGIACRASLSMVRRRRSVLVLPSADGWRRWPRLRGTPSKRATCWCGLCRVLSTAAEPPQGRRACPCLVQVSAASGLETWPPGRPSSYLGDHVCEVMSCYASGLDVALARIAIRTRRTISTLLSRN